MTIPLPVPYLPGLPGSGLDPTEFADNIQQNFDALATKTVPLSNGRAALGLGSTDDVTFDHITATGGVSALAGQVSTFSYINFPEVADPAGAANAGILYARDNGAGKTQLCVQFGSGAVQVIATEP